MEKNNWFENVGEGIGEWRHQCLGSGNIIHDDWSEWLYLNKRYVYSAYLLWRHQHNKHDFY